MKKSIGTEGKGNKIANQKGVIPLQHNWIQYDRDITSLPEEQPKALKQYHIKEQAEKETFERMESIKEEKARKEASIKRATRKFDKIMYDFIVDLDNSEETIFKLANRLMKRLENDKAISLHQIEIEKEKKGRKKKITPKTVEQDIQGIENAIGKMISDFISNDSNNIFQIIKLTKRIRNIGDREKRECERIYKDELKNAA
jgi:hypothetical protein